MWANFDELSSVRVELYIPIVIYHELRRLDVSLRSALYCESYHELGRYSLFSVFSVDYTGHIHGN